MNTLNSLPIDVLQQIVIYLDAIDISRLDTVLATYARSRLRNELYHRLILSYQREEQEELQLDAKNLDTLLFSPIRVPWSFSEYKKVQEVSLNNIGSLGVDLTPSLDHLSAWGRHLRILKVQTFRALFLFLTPTFKNEVYRPSVYANPCDEMNRVWEALRIKDGLPNFPSVANSGYSLTLEQREALYQTPNFETLTNPWIDMAEIAPNLKIFHISMLSSFVNGGERDGRGGMLDRHGDRSVPCQQYASDYIGLLWRTLPKNFEELAQSVVKPFHPASLPHLPRTLKSYISCSHNLPSYHVSTLSADERNCFPLKRVLLLLPSTLQTLVALQPSIDARRVKYLPKGLTSLHATIDLINFNWNPDDAEEGDDMLIFNPLSCLSHLNQLVDLRLQGRMSSFQFSSLPPSLLHLRLQLCILEDSDQTFSGLPSSLETLEIEELARQTNLETVLPTAPQYDQLPHTITHLDIGTKIWRYSFALKEREYQTLNFLKHLKELSYVATYDKIIVDVPLLEIFPLLRRIFLPNARFTQEAFDSLTERLKSKIDWPLQRL